jgi:hypothetical protein
LKRLRGVHNIIRSQAVMQPARRARIPDRFTHGHRESDHVVFYAGFGLMDLRHIDFGARANCRSRILGDLARFGKRLSSSKFDFQPLRKLVRITPNVAHFLARVAWNQLLLLTAEQRTWRFNFQLP